MKKEIQEACRLGLDDFSSDYHTAHEYSHSHTDRYELRLMSYRMNILEL